MGLILTEGSCDNDGWMESKEGLSSKKKNQVK